MSERLKDLGDMNFLDFGDAPCSETYPDMFFADDPAEGIITVRATYEHENNAKKVCAECPYRLACLSFALKDPSLEGIWGGTTERDRVNIRKGHRGPGITYNNRHR